MLVGVSSAATPPTTPEVLRDIHVLPTLSSHRSQRLLSNSSLEGFTGMSRESNALVLAGDAGGEAAADTNLERNQLAIVADTSTRERAVEENEECAEGVLRRAKREEVKAKISAWRTSEIAKINSRWKREEVVIKGWEEAQVEKATTTLNNIERKLDQKRAKAVEKMQNEVAKTRQKAGEKRASSEAKKGMKIARILKLANLMKAIGRTPTKHYSF